MYNHTPGKANISTVRVKELWNDEISWMHHLPWPSLMSPPRMIMTNAKILAAVKITDILPDKITLLVFTAAASTIIKERNTNNHDIV